MRLRILVLLSAFFISTGCLLWRLIPLLVRLIGLIRLLEWRLRLTIHKVSISAHWTPQRTKNRRDTSSNQEPQPGMGQEKCCENQHPEKACETSHDSTWIER